MLQSYRLHRLKLSFIHKKEGEEDEEMLHTSPNDIKHKTL
jgi:hypothetical protein